MKFWEEMQTKWGFNEGEAEPSGIEVYREAYIRAVNHLAAKNGSQCRVIAFNRNGMHNSVLTINVSLEFYSTLTESEVFGGISDYGDAEHIDDALGLAVRQAMDSDVDSHVTVTATLHMAALIEGLDAIEHEQEPA